VPRFIHQSVIPAPVSRVFAFHESPGALEALIPPWERAEVVVRGGSLAPGTRVVLRLHAGPLSLEWEAIHTRYEKDVLFQDEQRRGPFRRWLHTHHFLPDVSGGTLLRDEVEWELPLGKLGNLLGRPLVERRLERMFTFRHQATARACSGP
jgi:ligand-binding SRPBCC domain-containing protein